MDGINVIRVGDEDARSPDRCADRVWARNGGLIYLQESTMSVKISYRAVKFVEYIYTTDTSSISTVPVKPPAYTTRRVCL